MKWAIVLWSLVASTLLSLLAWGTTLFFVSPENATVFEWALFVGTLFLVLTGVFAIGGLVLRRVLFGTEQTLMRVGTSIRQGMFLAIFCLGILFLLRAGWLAWWDVILCFGFLFLIELFFLRTFRVKDIEQVSSREHH